MEPYDKSTFHGQRGKCSLAFKSYLYFYYTNLYYTRQHDNITWHYKAEPHADNKHADIS